MKIIFIILLFFESFLFFCSSLPASESESEYEYVITYSDWSNSTIGLSNWTNVKGHVDVTVVGNNLQMICKSQFHTPHFEDDIIKADIPYNVLISSVEFSAIPIEYPPSCLRFCFYSKAGRKWRLYLSTPTLGRESSYKIILIYDEKKWVSSDGTRGAYSFNEDLRNIDSIGIYLRRHSSVQRQTYQIQNFIVNGRMFVNDADKDMLLDTWEISHGLNSNDYNDARLDYDGDGLINYYEYVAGTDPLDFQSSLRIVAISSSNNYIWIQWDSVTGRRYEVWRALDPMQKFMGISGPLLATPPRNTYSDLSDGSNKFYRIKIDI